MPEEAMKEVVAVIRNEKWQATRLAIEAVGVEEMVQRRVLGRGRQRGLRYLRRASDAGEGGMPFLPKRMVTCVVADDRCDALVSAIIKTNQTGNVGDGKIFVRPIVVLERASEAKAPAAAAALS